MSCPLSTGIHSGHGRPRGDEDPEQHYHDYLQLDKVLGAQNPVSSQYGPEVHDETLFIIVHQAYELWFRQILHEIHSIMGIFSQDSVPDEHMSIAVQRLFRVTEIQKLLIQQIGILETMTPMDFMEFREYLNPASGFQSLQFRLVENKLGLRRSDRVNYNRTAYVDHLPSEEQRQSAVDAEENQTLFDLIEQWLERTPFVKGAGFDFWQAYEKAVAQDVVKMDTRTVETNAAFNQADKEAHLGGVKKIEEKFQAILNEDVYNEKKKALGFRFSHRAMKACLLIHLYRDQPILQQPFRLLQLLGDVDEHLTTWRYRHAMMVQRMIGTRVGTGGSSGYYYLRATAEKHKIFPDLANISSYIVARHSLPPIPEEWSRGMGFIYGQQG